MKTLIVFILGLIAAPVLLVVAGMLGWLGSTGTGDPPGWEISLGGRMVDAALEKRAKGVTNPIAASDTAALAAGRRLYAMNCSGCHGTAQAKSEWGSKGFYPRVPQFWQGDAADVTPKEAYVAIRDGIRYSGMGAWKDLMKDDDMWKVANFVARIHDLPTAQKPKAQARRVG